jgi:hypothetical protein
MDDTHYNYIDGKVVQVLKRQHRPSTNGSAGSTRAPRGTI